MTRVAPSTWPAPWPADPQHIERAAQRWRAGELVAFPTETVYGLGADAMQDAAVARIFEAKGRPSDHPLIVHVAHAEQARGFAAQWSQPVARMLAKAWPGPLTVIVPRRAGVATAAAGGQDSVGLRCPSHPVALALLQAAHRVGVAGVAGPSANRFGRVSPTCAAHVIQEFEAHVPVVDGGECSVGIESTIVDATRDTLVVLRPGHYTAAQLSEWAGQTVWAHDPKPSQAPKASGTLASHYAPRAKVRLMARAPLLERCTQASQTPKAGHHLKVAVWSPDAAPPGWTGAWRAQPTQAQACAQSLYATLRELDALGVDEIWVAQVPSASELSAGHADEWAGVADRLQRAAA